MSLMQKRFLKWRHITVFHRWKEMIKKYPEFYHVFGEGKWDNPIGDNYNVKATPSYFVLDKNKVIIKKPYDFEAFKDYFSEIKAIKSKD